MVTIAALNAIVLGQQKQIDALTTLVDNLAVGLGGMWDSSGTSVHTNGHGEGVNAVVKNALDAKAVVAAHMNKVQGEVYAVAQKKGYMDWHVRCFGCTPEEQAERTAAIAQAKKQDDADKLLHLDNVRLAAEAEEREKIDLAATIVYVAALEIETKQAEAEADAVTRENLEEKGRVLRARLAEARAVKAAPKKKAKGKANGIDSWSYAKCAQMSEAWCE
jgi:hypothetical protein